MGIPLGSKNLAVRIAESNVQGLVGRDVYLGKIEDHYAEQGQPDH